MGGARKDLPDVLTPELRVEVKYRKNLPVWLESALPQAQTHSRGKKGSAVVVVKAGTSQMRVWAPISILEGKDNGNIQPET
mgnify:CR=1 FL=1